MDEPTVLVQADEGSMLPEYQSSCAAGADLRAQLEKDLVLLPGQRALVPSGLRIQLPRGYEAQIRPRSGLALKHGITCLNSPGTIDSDYRGPVGIILINHGNETVTIKNGERIAQLVVAPVSMARFVKTDSLEASSRQDGGFGSTGR